MLLVGPHFENCCSKVTMHPWSISVYLINTSPLHHYNVSSTSGEVLGLSTLILIGRTDAKAEAPILWPPDANSLERTLIFERIEGRIRRADRD